jgi:hypothetical protein
MRNFGATRGIDQQLSPQELADFLAFVEACK